MYILDVAVEEESNPSYALLVFGEYPEPNTKKLVLERKARFLPICTVLCVEWGFIKPRTTSQNVRASSKRPYCVLFALDFEVTVD